MAATSRLSTAVIAHAARREACRTVRAAATSRTSPPRSPRRNGTDCLGSGAMSASGPPLDDSLPSNIRNGSPPLASGKSPNQPNSVVGRDPELVRIRDLLDAVRSGTSQTLVIAGEAGIGKTTLLEAAQRTAEGFECLWVRGIESEAVLGYAALLELATPLLQLLDKVPPAQAAALSGALGRATADAPADRFLVAAATLSLLAAAADQRPVLVLVDDAQWLDTESAAALLFAARRLSRDAVAFLFTMRAGTAAPVPLDGLPRLTVPGVSPAAGRRAPAITAARGRTSSAGVREPVQRAFRRRVESRPTVRGEHPRRHCHHRPRPDCGRVQCIGRFGRSRGARDSRRGRAVSPSSTAKHRPGCGESGAAANCAQVAGVRTRAHRGSRGPPLAPRRSTVCRRRPPRARAGGGGRALPDAPRLRGGVCGARSRSQPDVRSTPCSRAARMRRSLRVRRWRCRPHKVAGGTGARRAGNRQRSR